MATHAPTDGARTPLHLWIIGALALVWNGFGATDYTMTRLRNTDYLATMMHGVDPNATLAYIDSLPLLAGIGWGFGVWGALVGTLLLLARRRHAVIAYLASLVGAVVSFSIQLTRDNTPEGMDDPVIPIVITTIALGLLLYASAMRKRGVLR